MRRGAALLAIALLWPTTGPAYDPEWGTLTLEYENDLFAGEDRYYTSGVRATWLSPDERIPSWVQSGADLFPFFEPHGDLKLSYSLGQNMYTPEDIEDPDPPRGDRPYAGWLYFTVGLGNETARRVDRLQLNVGVVGPASLAEKTQAEIHRFTGSPQPKAWDTQLRNEPTVMLSYERQWRAWIGTGMDGWGMDVTPHVGGAVGNVFTQVSAGLTVRAGRDLPLDWGPPRIQPALPGSGVFRPRSDFGWYIFAGLDGRAVARDIFLDGNTFRDSRSADKRPFIGEVQVGGAVNIGRRFRLTYTHVFPTREFRGQEGTQDFGAIAGSMVF